ncbi:hypothetical protein D3H65_28220 [Paraflavitalea soli]|uniref:Uncharacterized protein n=1 Tax=Paraflavitalea soli TaxID=2315862 RepID=A0A3B7N6F8_9BACT|nr:hypothetical protein [Paraflavitalea soli]AXY77631.1 hypothetical protein D3H65_28220 [Paraflavitalea soli]
MRKTYLIIALILGAVLTALLIVKKNYDQSPEYNYLTAKLDIRKGNCRLVRVGTHTISPQEQAIEGVASKYGFKNVYIEKVSARERKGIDHYNETIEIYLSFRNGPDWKANYQHEVDSILKITVTLQPFIHINRNNGYKDQCSFI